MIHFEKIDFVVFELLDLLSHSLDSLDKLRILDLEKVRLFTVLLLKAMWNLMMFLGRCGEVSLVEERVVKKMRL